MEMLKNVVLGGAGVSLVLLILARMVPNEKLGAWGEALGKLLSAFGTKKLSKSTWEKVEDFLENSLTVFFAGLRKGLDSDDDQKEEPQTSQGGGAPLKLFLLLGMALLLGSGHLRAEWKPWIQKGPWALQWPFVSAEAVHLYDLAQGRGLVGVETPMIGYRTVRLTTGAVSTLEGRGAPFVGFDRYIAKAKLSIGFWVARDFRLSRNRGGIKASIPLW